MKYGVTRDSLLGLEVVLADGRAVRLGRRTRKGVAGYDLVGLLCGSEGTLGIVTEATVRLRPPPAPAATLAASFPALRGAGDAVARIAREQRPSLLELMDRQTIRAVEAFEPQELDTDAAAMVFARADDGPRGVARRGRRDGADLRGVRRRPRRHQRRGGRGPDADGRRGGSPSPRSSTAARRCSTTSASRSARSPRCSTASRGSPTSTAS